MPLFKKILLTLFLIVIFLIGIYYASFCYAKKENILGDYDLYKNVSQIINLATKNIKVIFVYLYYSFIDSIIFWFSFRWNNMPDNVLMYTIFTGLVGFPSILFFFRFLTYRGLKAIKLMIKKAKANPSYYADWKESIKFSTYDNIADPLPFGVQCIVFTFRIIIMFFMLLVLPFIMLFIILLNLIGILKGITHTGRVNDFD